VTDASSLVPATLPKGQAQVAATSGCRAREVFSMTKLKGRRLAVRYTAFAGMLTWVFGLWLLFTLAAELAFRLNLIDIEEYWSFASAAEIYSLRLHPRKDLALAVLVVPLAVALGRRFRSAEKAVLLWVDVLGAFAGLGLSIGMVYYPPLALSGRLPSFGVEPNSWIAALLLAAAVLGLIHGAKLFLAPRA
jgi:hypothetical protein